MRNLVKCVQELGVDIQALVFSGLAASEAVLTETEKELGVCLVDIGGGTTSVTVFIEGSLAYSSVIPVGARNITNDLAIGLRVSLDSAEKIKKVLTEKQVKVQKPEKKKDKGKDDDEIDLTGLGIDENLRSVSRKTVIEGIIQPRVNEIFKMVGEELKESGYGGGTPAGIVVTGGGAQTEDIVRMAKRTLSLPVRVGKPTGLSGLIEEIKDPAFAVAQGLILYGHKNFQESKSGPFSLSKIGNVLGRIPARGAVNKVVDFVKSFLP
jgi:cell division protein FtsA